MTLKTYFGFDSKPVSREVYARANLSLFAIMLLLRFLILPIVPVEAGFLVVVLAIVVGISAIVVLFVLTEKRVIDAKLNKNLKYLILVPYLNIIFFIYLCFKDSPNYVKEVENAKNSEGITPNRNQQNSSATTQNKGLKVCQDCGKEYDIYSPHYCEKNN